MPNFVFWPGVHTLKIAMTPEAAQAFIDTYPNPWLRSYLTIEEEEMNIHETD